MVISVINHTNGKLKDEEIQCALRAINRQVAEDFMAYWSLGATLRLEGRGGSAPRKQHIADMRGDAVLYLWDKVNVKDALGYHDKNNNGIPYGFIFTELTESLDESWTVTLSHEALELIADPEANLFVMGPHPAKPHKTVFHWYEMSDAVQAETYQIDGIDVSNFVLPLYFTGGEELGGRNDFLGNAHRGRTLRSFGVNPGGYIGFFDPSTGKHHTFAAEEDEVAARRRKIKAAAREARRAGRHQVLGTGRTAGPLLRRAAKSAKAG